MNIFICASKHCYGHVAAVKEGLEKMGHVVTLPNSYDNPGKEMEMHNLGAEEHSKWKGERLRLQKEKVMANDAIVVLNFEKNGQPNYIGGATFLEVYEAFRNDKKIFFYNPLPEGMLHDELLGIRPVVINGDLNLVE